MKTGAARLPDERTHGYRLARFAVLATLAAAFLLIANRTRHRVPTELSADAASLRPLLRTAPHRPTLLTVNMGTVPRPNGRVSVGYFPNWAIYGRDYKPKDIPVQDLTHVLYAFAAVKSDGEVALTDQWADEQIHYSDSWDEQGGPNLYGNLKALYLLKQSNRHLKVLLSIGGWNHSQNGTFAKPVSTSSGQARFVETSVRIVEDYGLDGLDCDWEYPENDKEARDYVELLRQLRQGLDGLQQKLGMHSPHGFELTVAAPGGPDQIQKLRLGEMDRYLSFWNLMAYDYSGSWSSTAEDQAGVFNSTKGELCTDRALRMYTDSAKGGVSPGRIVLGMPLYGRSFLHTNGRGTPFQGVGNGSFETGVYDYKALPLPGAAVTFDAHLVAASCYNPATREWVSYDSPESAAAKATFINVNGLGGAMWWELSGDKPRGQGGLVATVKDGMAGAGPIDSRPNWLDYKTSKFENLRNGMR